MSLIDGRDETLDLPPAEVLLAALRRNADAERRARGEAYLQEGMVLDVTRRGDDVTAAVEGSYAQPYRVVVRLVTDGIDDATCTCPYDWGGWCKHVAAVVLALCRSGGGLEERPPLRELLADQGQGDLIDLVEHLADLDPGVLDVVEARLQIHAARRGRDEDGSTGDQEPRVDGPVFRRRVKAALHSLDRMRRSEAYWHVGGVVETLRAILGEAQELLEAGDAEGALVVLEALTDEYVADWTVLDGSDGETGEFFWDLGPVWAQVALAADVAVTRRKGIAAKLDAWQAEIDDYGVEGAFDAAIEAARHGWSAPGLQGGTTRKEAGGDESLDIELAAAGIAVLRRQDRHEDALALARRAGADAEVVEILVGAGRVLDAAQHAVARITRPGGALAAARSLWARGARREALEVGRHGLGLGEDCGRGSLAEWLCDAAVAQGDRSLAQEAAEAAFRARPRLDAFLRVKELSGRKWPSTRKRLLAHLRSDDAWPEECVVIMLHEGLEEEAMQVAEAEGSFIVVEPVVDAVLTSHPEWAAAAARSQAEDIMDRGQSRIYHHAVRWLEKCRNAHLAAGTDDAWHSYIGGLVERHRRKYKLRAMLEGIR